MQSVLWRLCWQIFQLVGGLMPHSLQLRRGRLCGHKAKRLWCARRTGLCAAARQASGAGTMPQGVANAQNRGRAQNRGSQRLAHRSIRHSWHLERRIWCWHMFSGLYEPLGLPRAQSVRALTIRGCQTGWHGIAATQGEGTAGAGRARACTDAVRNAHGACARAGF